MNKFLEGFLAFPRFAISLFEYKDSLYLLLGMLSFIILLSFIFTILLVLLKK